jgi:hypothetical protein
MRLVGALGSGQTPDGDETGNALSILNGILDQWSTERQMISALSRVSNSWAGGLASKLIGLDSPQPPGSIAVTRPIRIEQASATIGSSEYVMDSLDETGYARYDSKGSQGTPGQFYYRATAPMGEIFILPIPAQSIILNLWIWIPFGTFATPGSEMDLPPTYEKALKYALAVELCLEWTGREASATVIQGMIDAKANIKRINAPVIRIPQENMARYSKNYGNSFDIMSGRYL